MDELVILDHVGIDVDPALIDQMPGRHADLLSDHGLICLERNRRLFPDFVHELASGRAFSNSGKSSSRNSSPRSESLRILSRSRRRKCTRRIFPEIVFGNSLTSSIRLTRLNGASRASRCWKIDRATSLERSVPGTSRT